MAELQLRPTIMITSTTLTKPPYFNYGLCLMVLGDNDFECLHFKKERTLTKALEKDGKKLVFRLSEEGRDVKIELLEGEAAQLPVAVDYVKEWFDLERDLSPFYRLLRKDEDLAHLADEYSGLRLMGIPDLFEALCYSILGQQINVTFTAKLKRRLVENFGSRVEADGQSYLLFPRPETIAGLEVEQLRPFQISQRKAEYIIGVARLFAEGKMSKAQLLELEEPEAVLKALTDVRGIGLWTANYAMMKSLQLPNSVPYGDTGLNSALHQYKNTSRRPSREEIDAVFDQFEGWKAYLTRYLWRSLAN